MELECFPLFDAFPVGRDIDNAVVHVFGRVLEWFRGAGAIGASFDICRAVVTALYSETVDSVIGGWGEALGDCGVVEAFHECVGPVLFVRVADARA